MLPLAPPWGDGEERTRSACHGCNCRQRQLPRLAPIRTHSGCTTCLGSPQGPDRPVVANISEPPPSSGREARTEEARASGLTPPTSGGRARGTTLRRCWAGWGRPGSCSLLRQKPSEKVQLGIEQSSGRGRPTRSKKALPAGRGRRNSGVYWLCVAGPAAASPVHTIHTSHILLVPYKLHTTWDVRTTHSVLSNPLPRVLYVGTSQ